MALVELTQEGLAGSKLFQPGWYELVVHKCSDKESKDKKSMNTWMTFKCVDEGEYLGETVPVCINHPYAHIVLKKLLPAVNIELKPGNVDLSESAWKGLAVQAFIKQRPDSNDASKLMNDIADFRPTGTPR